MNTLKITGLITCMFLFFSSITLAQTITETNSNKESMTEIQKYTYSLGVKVAQDLKAAGVEKIDTDLLLQAIEAQMAGKAKMSSKEAGQFIKEFAVKQLKKEGESFLAMNSTKEGVVVLPSGLQYEVMTAGGGAQKPSATSKVKTHYHGMLIDGTVFDSSVDRGEPISFPVNGVIKGWQEALQLMSVGDKWRLYIPSDLAYGARGAGGVILPHAALIFEVELLGIE